MRRAIKHVLLTQIGQLTLLVFFVPGAVMKAALSTTWVTCEAANVKTQVQFSTILLLSDIIFSKDH